MKAAVLNEYGTPVYTEFEKPSSSNDNVVVDVRAAAISHFDIIYASGTHSLKPPALPCIAGFEGVGNLPDGRLVYFSNPVAPYGSMAERALVSSKSMIEVPDGTDASVAALLANSGLAAWLPLSWRANVQPGETVMILGATGVVGQLAVQSAKLLGAGKVIAVGRDDDKLARIKQLGADATFNSETQNLSECVRAMNIPNGVNVIIDYVWGQPALDALHAASVGARLVQVGTMASDSLTLSGALIRGKNLAVMGFANYHAAQERYSAYQEVCKLARDGKLIVELERVPLSEIENAWEIQRKGHSKRFVVIP